jgi:glutathione S-transferase
MTDLRLYDYAASANCLKVRMLLAMLDRPYERVPIDIFAGETLTDEFATRNPARTVPVLEYAPGRYLAESNAILLALAEGTPYLPEAPDARWQVYRWLLFEQAEVVATMGGLRFRLQTGRLDPESEGAVQRRRDSEATLDVLDRHLAARPFAVSEAFSIADIALYAYVHVAPEAGIDLACHPHVERWLRCVEAQPGFVNDLEPYPPDARAGAGQSIYD